MSGPPGTIVNADGTIQWVEDKFAYLQQHPEAIEPTREAVKKHTELRMDVARHYREQDEQNVIRREQYEARLACGKSFGHYCIKGKVVKDCDECRKSLAG